MLPRRRVVTHPRAGAQARRARRPRPAVDPRSWTSRQRPLRTAEFLVVDVETNGSRRRRVRADRGRRGADRRRRAARPLRVADRRRRPPMRAVQRLTGISARCSPPLRRPRPCCPRWPSACAGRVMVAHNAAFDRRALAQAFDAAGLAWPEPPVICTIALARRFAPLVRERRLGALARALEVETGRAPRARGRRDLRARLLRAVRAPVRARRDRRRRGRAARSPAPARAAPARAGAPGAGAGGRPRTSTSALPAAPGVYVFRDAAGRALYVGKSVNLRTRARAHFAPGASAGGLARPRRAGRPPRDGIGAGRAAAGEPADQASAPGRETATSGGWTRGATSSAAWTSRSRCSRSPRARRRARGLDRAAARAPAPRAGRAARLAVRPAPLRPAACRAASTRPRTARWGAACRRAWATSIPTSTAAGSTRRCRGRWTAATRARRCSRTSSGGCARRRPSAATSAPRPCVAAAGGCRRCWSGSTACCARARRRPPGRRRGPGRREPTPSGSWADAWSTGDRPRPRGAAPADRARAGGPTAAGRPGLDPARGAGRGADRGHLARRERRPPQRWRWSPRPGTTR